MSRIQASGSRYCAEAREPGSDGRYAIISRNAGERNEPRVFSFPIRDMQWQFESGIAAGLGEAVSFGAVSYRTLWKPERAALMAVCED